jgi:deoxyribodipyrimidine photo-lyase
MATSVMWFRRDLRLSDNPALVAALRAAGPSGDTVGAFCLDPRLERVAGTPRRAFLARCVRALDESMGGALVVVRGDPAIAIPRLADEVEATSVHVAADYGPYGSARDDRVRGALEARGVALEEVGSSYAVPPGAVLNRAGQPYRVFTPFSRAWEDVGWDAPVRAPSGIRWATGVRSEARPEEPACDARLPDGGEAAAKRAARRFWDTHLDAYDTRRDLPGADATSRLSPHLKLGTIHPRQLLAKLGRSAPHRTFRTELCWREFYADVLHDRPDTVRGAYVPKMRALRVDTGRTADERFRAWAEGRTGFPIVDAAMRQLLAEAWMHNRARMVVASFLVKDLHIDWTRGAAHFMRHLVDGDLASNQHGWQWVAGTGTDASPFVRIFNPVTQGQRFDPDGTYVRRWVPELSAVPDRYLHRPWDDPEGAPPDYPAPIVDHAEERDEALQRFEQIR